MDLGSKGNKGTIIVKKPGIIIDVVGSYFYGKKS